MGFEYEIIYWPGKTNVAADSLSGRVDSPMLHTLHDAECEGILAPQFSIWDDLKEANTREPYLVALHQKLESQLESMANYMAKESLLYFKG